MSDTPIMDEAYNQAMDGRIGVTGIMNAACKLERELAEALRESEERNQQWALKSIYASELEQTVSNINSQLTSHKAALEKCEKALFATWADLDHLNHWMPTPCRELYMEALSEIAKLKGTK